MSCCVVKRFCEGVSNLLVRASLLGHRNDCRFDLFGTGKLLEPANGIGPTNVFDVTGQDRHPVCTQSTSAAV